MGRLQLKNSFKKLVVDNVLQGGEPRTEIVAFRKRELMRLVRKAGRAGGRWAVQRGRMGGAGSRARPGARARPQSDHLPAGQLEVQRCARPGLLLMHAAVLALCSCEAPVLDQPSSIFGQSEPMCAGMTARACGRQAAWTSWWTGASPRRRARSRTRATRRATFLTRCATLSHKRGLLVSCLGACCISRCVLRPRSQAVSCQFSCLCNASIPLSLTPSPSLLDAAVGAAAGGRTSTRR